MAVILGACIALALVWAVVHSRQRNRRTDDVVPFPVQQSPPVPAAPPAAPAKPAPPRPTVSGEDVANTIGGWMLGHEIARGHHGFPGDPLPGGHLGSASDLAFWGGILDDDPDDPDF